MARPNDPPVLPSLPTKTWRLSAVAPHHLVQHHQVQGQHHDTTSYPGFPHNPYNGVICNDVVAASGVFTTKELWKFAKCKLSHLEKYSVSYIYLAASIMAGGSHIQSNFNSIKLENPGYYCNSYTPPGGPPEHHPMLAAGPGYSKSHLDPQ